MTKNLLILTMFFFCGIKLFAQCTPDTSIKKPGFYPSTLPNAKLNAAYNQVLQFRIIKDTTVIFSGVPISATVDSLTIVEVNGMPDGLTFQLNKPSQTYTPEEVGCALISGTPNKKDTFYLEIVTLIYAKVGSFPASQVDTMDQFYIVVDETGAIDQVNLKSFNVYPNPLKGDMLTFNKELVGSGSKLSIYNSTGQLLSVRSLESSGNTITFAYPKGLYILSFDNGNTVQRIKLIKE